MSIGSALLSCCYTQKCQAGKECDLQQSGAFTDTIHKHKHCKVFNTAGLLIDTAGLLDISGLHRPARLRLLNACYESTPYDWTAQNDFATQNWTLDIRMDMNVCASTSLTEPEW